MLTTLFLYIWYLEILVITAPLRLLADVTLDSNITSSIHTASGYLAGVNSVFPVTTLLTILGLYLALEVAILLYKLINWLIRKIPTIS